MTELERLKELEANVSPGSWSENGIRELLRFGNKHDGPWNEGRNYIPDEKDADLIAVACSNLPALLEVVEALDNLVLACELPGDHCEVEQSLPFAKQALAPFDKEVE